MSLNRYLILGSVVAVGLLGTAAWAFTRPRYAEDVRVVCESEMKSGAKLTSSAASIDRWIQAHVRTNKGKALALALQSGPVEERGHHLQAEANAVGRSDCPLVNAYVDMADRATLRSDLGFMCAPGSFPEIPYETSEHRIATLRSWVVRNAKSPKAVAFVDSLAAVPPDERGKKLETSATELHVFACELANVLGAPTLPPRPLTVSIQGSAQLSGKAFTEETFAAQMEALQPTLLACYVNVWKADPKIEGSITYKVSISGGKDPVRVVSMGEGLKNQPLRDCVSAALRRIHSKSKDPGAGDAFFGLQFKPPSAPP